MLCMNVDGMLCTWCAKGKQINGKIYRWKMESERNILTVHFGARRRARLARKKIGGASFSIGTWLEWMFVTIVVTFKCAFNLFLSLWHFGRRLFGRYARLTYVCYCRNPRIRAWPSPLGCNQRTFCHSI